MSYIKAVPLSQLSKYSAADDQIVLLSSTNEQPGDAAELSDAIGASGAEDNTSLRGLKNCLTTQTTSSDFTISAIFLGDSFAATGSLFNFGFVTRVVGSYRTGSLTAGGDSGVTVVSDYTKSPSGSYNSIASGGNLTAAHLQTGTQGPASHAYYTLFTGTGTAQLQYKKGAGAWTNLGSTIDTTAIASVSVATVALPDTSANYAVRVTATGGTVNGWIGQGLSGPGLTVADFAVAGHNIEQVGGINETIWKAMVAGYKASGSSGQIIMTGFADYRFTTVATTAWPTKGTEGWGAAGPVQTLHDWSRTANATADWLVVGPHQVDTTLTESADALVDAAFTGIGINSNTNTRTVDGSRAQREFAVRNRAAFADCVNLTDYTNGNAEGLYGDTIHFNAKGQNLKRSHIFRETNLGWIISPIQQTSGFRIGNIYLGSTPTRASTASLVAYVASDGIGGTLVPITGSNLRAGDSVNPEQSGMEFAWVSTNLARIRAYSSSGPNSYGLDVGYAGAGISVRPSVTSSSELGSSSLPWGKLYLDKTITAAAATGAQTISKPCGSVNFAAAATTLVVTNTLAVAPTSGTTGSIIIATVRTNDTTMKSVAAVCSSNGSFTLHANAAATAETRVDFAIITP
jgi:hypothetical protein